jgi:hypothetical protein
MVPELPVRRLLRIRRPTTKNETKAWGPFSRTLQDAVQFYSADILGMYCLVFTQRNNEIIVTLVA